MRRLAPALLAAAIGGAGAQTLTVELAAGDYVEARLASPDAVAVDLIGPDGARLRRYAGAAGDTELLFVAQADGRHRLQVVAGSEPTAGAARRLELRERVPRLALRRETPAEAAPQSARLRALIAAHGAGTPAFWAAVEALGTPLVDPLPDADAQLVTFVWRGADTRSVRAFWPIRATGHLPFARMPGTDLWHLSLRLPPQTRMSYQLAPDVPQFDGGPASRQRRAILAVAQADPLNRRRWLPQPLAAAAGETAAAGATDRYAAQSIVELAQAPAEPWIEARPDAAPGRLQTLTYASARLGNARTLSVYTPPPGAVAAGARLPLLLLFDRRDYLTRVPTPTLLDNLIAAGRIPPLVAVFVDHPTRAARATELPCNPDFADMLAQELLPWLRARWPVTDDPARVVVAGSSYGGLAAAWLGLRHPQAFGRVLALSGSFWWAPGTGVPAADDYAATPAAEWLTQRYAEAPRADVEFFLAPGRFERSTANDGPGILESSRHLRDVLLARGYRVHYREFAGGHDYLAWRGELADGLVTLLGAR